MVDLVILNGKCMNFDGPDAEALAVTGGEITAVGSTAEIKAMAAGAMVLGSALGPGIAGTLIDAGIDIQVQYLGIAAWFLAGSLAMAIGLHRARGLLTAAP